MIYLKLFISFLQVGLFSIGGGYAAMPLIQSQAVEKYAWLTMNEFTDLITIAEMTPGPIAVNSATFVGIRIAGFGGAVAATFGCILPSCFIVSFFALMYAKYKKGTGVQTVLSCLRPAVVALIASAGISVLITALFAGRELIVTNLSILSAVIFAAAFIVLRKFKLNPIAVMALSGAAGLAVNVIMQHI